MNREQPLTFGDWLVTILIMAIPLVNLVAVIYWAASGSTNISKQNYARASIAWFFIGLVIAAILSAAGLLSTSSVFDINGLGNTPGN